MNKTVHGVIHGKTIQLDQELGIADGQQVEIVVRSIASNSESLEGLRRSAGALANEWTLEDDRILEEIHRERGRDSTSNARLG